MCRPQLYKALVRFFSGVGIAYQMADDIAIDATLTTSAIGKEAGVDRNKRNYVTVRGSCGRGPRSERSQLTATFSNLVHLTCCCCCWRRCAALVCLSLRRLNPSQVILR